MLFILIGLLRVVREQCVVVRTGNGTAMSEKTLKGR